MDSLALTFDDGPDPCWTPALLDTLRQTGARATFFPITARAVEHPALIARMVAEGHAVGLHCGEHLRHSARDRAWLETDTELAMARLAALGVRATLWRTPWGDVAPWTQAIAARHGLRLVGWSIDTHDWRGDAAAGMFATARSRLRSGATVLAHDGIGPGARRAHAGETVAFTELVAAHARRQRLGLAALA